MHSEIDNQTFVTSEEMTRLVLKLDHLWQRSLLSVRRKSWLSINGFAVVSCFDLGRG